MYIYTDFDFGYYTCSVYHANVLVYMYALLPTLYKVVAINRDCQLTLNQAVSNRQASSKRREKFQFIHQRHRKDTMKLLFATVAVRMALLNVVSARLGEGGP